MSELSGAGPHADAVMHEIRAGTARGRLTQAWSLVTLAEAGKALLQEGKDA